jgi:hypothetical protein
VGDTLEVSIGTNLTTCSGAGQITWSLPTGLMPDLSKLPSPYAQLGMGQTFNTSTNAIVNGQVIAQVPNPLVILEMGTTNATQPAGGAATCAIVGSGGNVRMTFSVPIVGWNVNN